MKKTYLILSTSLFSLTFPSCDKVDGIGEPVAEERTVTGYTGIGLAMDATVNFSEGEEYNMVVYAQDNLLPIIVTEPEGLTLVIKVRKGYTLGTHEPITIAITAPSVNRLDISGSGNINIAQIWEAEDLKTNISGSGNINMEAIDTDSFNANISGSGSILALSGETDYANLNISGSGNIDIRTVVAGTAYAKISGEGNIFVQVNELLDATISGSGSIYYTGSPQVNVHVSGSGKVTHL